MQEVAWELESAWKQVEEMRRSGLPAKEKRAGIAAKLREYADRIDREVGVGIHAYKPIGLMSELAIAMGVMPERGEAVGTPFGTYVFARGRIPSKETVDRWQHMHRQAERIRGLALEYAPLGLEARPGTVTGNYRVVEHARRLREQGLLSQEEDQVLGALERFWDEHPGLDRKEGYGVWGYNLEIMLPERFRMKTLGVKEPQNRGDMKDISWGADEILFPAGTVARNNRTDERFVLDRAVKGFKENREGRVYRLEYYMGDSHWVYRRDNESEGVGSDVGRLVAEFKEIDGRLAKRQIRGMEEYQKLVNQKNELYASIKSFYKSRIRELPESGQLSEGEIDLLAGDASNTAIGYTPSAVYLEGIVRRWLKERVGESKKVYAAEPERIRETLLGLEKREGELAGERERTEAVISKLDKEYLELSAIPMGELPFRPGVLERMNAISLQISSLRRHNSDLAKKLADVRKDISKIKGALAGRGMFVAEPQEEKPPSQEVKEWMKKALGIQDYEGGREDRINMLGTILYRGEIGELRTRGEAIKMAFALGRDLGYGEPPPYGISWERYYAEKIAAEKGKEVQIIEGAAVVKPPEKHEATPKGLEKIDLTGLYVDGSRLRIASGPLKGKTAFRCPECGRGLSYAEGRFVCGEHGTLPLGKAVDFRKIGIDKKATELAEELYRGFLEEAKSAGYETVSSYVKSMKDAGPESYKEYLKLGVGLEEIFMGKMPKEAWKMRFSEFYPYAGSEYTAGERFGIPTKNKIPIIPETGFMEKGATPEERIHRAVIRKALREGRPVPKEVLAEYPDLAGEIGKPEEKRIKPEEPKERILGELRTKYRFSRPEGDKVAKAIDSYLTSKNLEARGTPLAPSEAKNLVLAILEPVRDGKYIAEDLIAMIEGTYYAKKEVPAPQIPQPPTKPLEEEIREYGKWIRDHTYGIAGVRRLTTGSWEEVIANLKSLIRKYYNLAPAEDYVFIRPAYAQTEIGIDNLASMFYNIAANGWDLGDTFKEWKVRETRAEWNRTLKRFELGHLAREARKHKTYEEFGEAIDLTARLGTEIEKRAQAELIRKIPEAGFEDLRSFWQAAVSRGEIFGIEEEKPKALPPAKKEEPAPPTPPALPPAKPIQSIQEIKQQVLARIQAANTIEELQPILKEIGFYPLPEPEKRQIMDAYQNKYGLILSEIKFGVPIKVEEKPKILGAPTPQELWEAELKRRREEESRLRGQVPLTGAAATAARLGLFEPGAMEKAKAEAEAMRKIEELGLPYEVHPIIRKLASNTQEVLKFGSKRGKPTVEDLVLARYIQYCPPGTIIDNIAYPKVPERWWVYPTKLRACISEVEQKIGGILVKESTQARYSIYKDEKLFANEDDKTEANNIYNMLVRTFPRFRIELRENFVHPHIHQRMLKEHKPSLIAGMPGVALA